MQTVVEHPSPSVRHPLLSSSPRGWCAGTRCCSPCPYRGKRSILDADELLHRHRIQFVLEESECLAIHSAIEGMVEGLLTEIIVSCSILCHISIYLNSISQTIRGHEQQSQLTMVWVFYTHVIVVKVVHAQL